MTELLVRIESIYDVPLSKILRDEGNFSILSSINIDSADNGESAQPHDVHIGDLDRRMGIQVKGMSYGVEQIESILKERLPDSVLFKHMVQPDAIYNSKVVKNIYKKKIAILDLGDDKQGIMFNFDGQIDDELLVQIKEVTNEKDKLPVCSDIITLSGDFIILEADASFVRVSRKIKGQERKRLHELGKELLPEGFGIIIRTSAANITADNLEFEIKTLVQHWESILEDRKDVYGPQRLVAGEVQSELIFGHKTKSIFDKIRGTVIDTIPNYHHFKSYSMATGFTLDFAHNFTDKIPSELLSSTLYDMIIKRDYAVNNHIKGEFHFSDGLNEEVNLGDIQENKEYFKTMKIISPADVDLYSTLNLEVNDIMEVYFAPGSWTIHYKFYSKETEILIGQRIRIITPLDLIYRGRIRAFDMGLDIFYDQINNQLINALANHAEIDMVSRQMISETLNEKLGEVYRFALDQIEEGIDIIIYK